MANLSPTVVLLLVLVSAALHLAWLIGMFVFTRRTARNTAKLIEEQRRTTAELYALRTTLSE